MERLLTCAKAQTCGAGPAPALLCSGARRTRLCAGRAPVFATVDAVLPLADRGTRRRRSEPPRCLCSAADARRRTRHLCGVSDWARRRSHGSRSPGDPDRGKRKRPATRRRALALPPQASRRPSSSRRASLRRGDNSRTHTGGALSPALAESADHRADSSQSVRPLRG